MRTAGSLLLFAFLCPGAVVRQIELGSSAKNETCALTSTSTTFSASTRQVFALILLDKVKRGDTATIEFVNPAGKLITTVRYDSLPVSPSQCLISQLPVEGFEPSKEPGTWTVCASLNGKYVSSRQFKILPPEAAPSGIRISKVDARDGKILVEGEGFSNESLIHVAQYNSESGWSYLPFTAPEMVAPNKISVRTGNLKPGEYAIYAKSGAVLSAPVRLLISAGGYRMPFPPHEQWVISQMPFGSYSHWGNTAHAYDIAPRTGGCVAAMRGGTAFIFDLGLGQTPNRRIFGNYITIQHDDGEYSHYGHLRTGTFLVRNGERVEQGQALAVAGTSGYSFGTHVHVQVTRNFEVSSPSIPFQIEEIQSAGASRPGPVTSMNVSNYGDCNGAKPAQPTFLATGNKTVTGSPAWSGTVSVAAWWTAVTNIPAAAASFDVRVDWEGADRTLELHLVSPSGHHYGSYGDRTGLKSEASVSSFHVPNPEQGVWRVSVQGTKGTGESMPFRVFKNVALRTVAAASAQRSAAP